MKALYTYLLLTITVYQGLSQGLSIRFVDESSDIPIPAVLVTLSNSTDTLTAISGRDGVAYFPKSISGQLKTSHLVYHSHLHQVSKSSQNLNIELQHKNENLDEIVVTGLANASSRKKAIKPIRVISNQRIQDQAAINLKDLLSNDLNFRVSEDLVLGSQLSLQGLNGQKIKILVDGVPVIGRLDGNIDISQINLNNIDRVEIVEGPMAVEFGSDAIAGTINLITKKDYTQDFKFTSNAYYESVGRYNTDASFVANLKGTQTKLLFGRNFFDGYNPNESQRSSSWNPKEQYFGSINLRRRFGKLLLQLNTDYFNEKVVNLGDVFANSPFREPSLDSGIIVYPAAIDDYYRTTRLNNSVYTDYYFSKDSKIKAYIAYNYFERRKNSLLKNLGTGDEFFLEDPSTQDTTRFDLINARFIFSDNIKPNRFSYQLGTEVTHETSYGKRIEDGFKDQTDLAIFLSGEYQVLNRLQLKPGIRYTYNSVYNSVPIGSLSLRYQINSEIIVRASYGKGFRAPTLKELYFNFVDENHNILGNTDLAAERSDQFQLSLNYSKSFTKSTSLELSSSYYFNNLKDEIRLISVVDPTDDEPRGLFRNINVAETKTQGVNLNAELRIKNLRLSPGFTYAGELNTIAIDNGLADFNFFPQARFNVSYDYEPLDLGISLFSLYTGKRRQLIQNDEELITTEFEDYTMSDLTFNKSFWNKKLILSVGAKNILNVQNLASSNLVGSGVHSPANGSVAVSYGRTYFMRLQLKL